MTKKRPEWYRNLEVSWAQPDRSVARHLISSQTCAFRELIKSVAAVYFCAAEQAQLFCVTLPKKWAGAWFEAKILLIYESLMLTARKVWRPSIRFRRATHFHRIFTPLWFILSSPAPGCWYCRTRSPSPSLSESVSLVVKQWFDAALSSNQDASKIQDITNWRMCYPPKGLGSGSKVRVRPPTLAHQDGLKMGSRDSTWQLPDNRQDSVKRNSFSSELKCSSCATHSIRMDLGGTGAAELDQSTSQSSIRHSRQIRAIRLSRLQEVIPLI